MPGTTRELTNTADFPRDSNPVGTEVVPAVRVDGTPVGLPVSVLVQDGGITAGHIGDQTNPHNVTAAQVGLGNVNNTSDADKPVSTAQQAEIDAAKEEAISAISEAKSPLRVALEARRSEKASRKRKTGRKGKIFLTVGQSLSVRRDYTSGQPKVDWTSPYAYMIAGGADRNADADVAVNVTSFNADGVDYESLVQFVPGATQGGKIDGFAMMADCPTVCGIYAIGSRDYTQLRKGGSSLFVDTSMFLSQAVYLLRTQHDCEDIEIIFSLAHGEAETDNIASGGVPGSATPTTLAEYKRFMAEWFWDLRGTARMALDDPGYNPIFLVHQMGGVFNEDWIAIMEAQSEFADENPRVYLTGPTAPYGFQVDRIHPPGEAQALMGEWDWHLVNRAVAGLPTCLKAREFRRDGATITVPHDYVDGSVEVGINSGNMTDASGFQSSGAQCIYGVEVLVAGTPVDLVSVTPSGLVTTIVLAADPGASTVIVRFGLMTTVGGNAVVPATTSRCNIRSSWGGIPSRYITDFVHQAWLLHDEVEEAV